MFLTRKETKAHDYFVIDFLVAFPSLYSINPFVVSAQICGDLLNAGTMSLFQPESFINIT